MYLSHKYLNVECRKIDEIEEHEEPEDEEHNHGHSSSKIVDVKYIDEETDRLLKNEAVSVFPVELEAP